MNGRDRVLIALDGGEPDRVPRALSFYRVDIERLVPAGLYRGDEALVDVNFVDFPCRRRKRRWSGWPSPMHPTRGWAPPPR